KWGTHNALMYVRNAYIEWLSVENKHIAEKSDHQLVNLLLRDVSGGDAWGTICLTVDNIESFDTNIRARGYQTSGVIHAERKTARGDSRKWKMLFINQQPSANLPLPFFIEWEKGDEARLTELREDGTILPDNEKL
ncbi:VOC family protein, partial [Microvirga sp. 3-52]|nr:VOC family protein [Microvirga sp. 3-52]